MLIYVERVGLTFTVCNFSLGGFDQVLFLRVLIQHVTSIWKHKRAQKRFNAFVVVDLQSKNWKFSFFAVASLFSLFARLLRVCKLQLGIIYLFIILWHHFFFFFMILSHVLFSLLSFFSFYFSQQWYFCSTNCFAQCWSMHKHFHQVIPLQVDPNVDPLDMLLNLTQLESKDEEQWIEVSNQWSGPKKKRSILYSIYMLSFDSIGC